MQHSSTLGATARNAVPEADLDAATLQLLADRERVLLLAALGRMETSERLSALARTIAASGEAATPDDASTIHARLYHVHVPKLAEAGVLHYDEDDRTVELTARGETVAATLTDRDDLLPA